MMRKLLILLLLLVLILPALIGAGSRYLAMRGLDAAGLAPAAVDWRVGWLSSDVTLASALHPGLESGRGRLQHGPLLIGPLEPGWLRLRATAFPREGGAIPIAARLGLLGDWRVQAQLLPTTMALDGSLALTGRIGGDAVAARLDSPRGAIALPAGHLSWRQLEGQGEAAAPDKPLAGGQASLALASGAFAGGTASGFGSVRIEGASVQLRWPRAQPRQLRLQLTTDALERAQRRIKLAGFSATVDNVDRTVLAQILRQLPGAELSQGPRGTLAINLATLAGGNPQIRIERLNLTTPDGDFQLTGQIGIRPAGLNADLRGQVPITAMHHILTWWYTDPVRARQVLDEWITNGLFRRQDGMLAFEWVVNR